VSRLSRRSSFATTKDPAAIAASDPACALTLRVVRDGRVRTIAFGYLFAVYAWLQPVGYRHTYPTVADRVAFAHGFGGNRGLRLLYGEPQNLTTAAGYTAWRVGGTLAIAAAVFGLLAAVRAFRTEEDAGRMELVLAGVVSRRTAFLSALTAIAMGSAVLWIAEFGGFVVAGLPASGAAFLALATVSVVPVSVGVGAVASQLAPTSRVALALGGATIGLSFLLRVIPDTTNAFGWFRWLTPLGWAEELRPFAGTRPLVLFVPVVAATALIASAARIARNRDIGAGVLPAHDTAEPRLRLLSSATAQALRSERPGFAVWIGSTAAFAFLLGAISASVSSSGIPKSVQGQIAKLGSGSIATPAGYLAFVFIFFILAVSLFACAQIGSARREEARQQLETLLAQPVGRIRWLGGRLFLASCFIASISLVAGLMTWAGAASAGVDVSLRSMLEADLNCVPVALLFLGVAALAFALTPRASAGIAYGIVAVAFVWQLVGSLLGAPTWLVDATPFQHVGLVPAEAFRTAAALTMLLAGGLVAAAALAAFKRRDTVSA
jgi:ABC-2 type transport system permease protein